MNAIILIAIGFVIGWVGAIFFIALGKVGRK